MYIFVFYCECGYVCESYVCCDCMWACVFLGVHVCNFVCQVILGPQELHVDCSTVPVSGPCRLIYPSMVFFSRFKVFVFCTVTSRVTLIVECLCF